MFGLVAQGGDQALAQRRSGGSLAMERQRPGSGARGEPGALGEDHFVRHAIIVVVGAGRRKNSDPPPAPTPKCIS